MKKLKRIVVTTVYVVCIALLILFRNSINNYIIENYIYVKSTTIYKPNKYSKLQNYNYLRINKTFIANDKQDLLNIIYTIVDSGSTEFTFYCNEEYKTCQEDMEYLSNDTNYLTIINNFVNPYNSFNKLYISTNNIGKITVNYEKLYNENEIAFISEKLSSIEKEVIKENMSDIEKIRAIHDYIINTTIYDQERANKIQNKIFSINDLQTHKANGVLTNHIALCSGYTDVMAIYLNRLGIKNYKIANENHIWNALYLNNKWYHLDLTWDDPVTSNGKNVLIDDFFIVDNDTLNKKDTTQHIYNEKIYSEVATN